MHRRPRKLAVVVLLLRLAAFQARQSRSCRAMEAALAAVVEDFRVCAARAAERLQAAAADELTAAQEQLAAQEEALTRREQRVSEREEALRRREQELLKQQSGKLQELATGIPEQLCFHADLPTPTRAPATAAAAAAGFRENRASQPALPSPGAGDSTNAATAAEPLTPAGSTSALRDVFENKAAVRRISGEPQQQTARSARGSDERGQQQQQPTARTARGSDEWAAHRINSSRVGTPLKARPVGEDLCMPGESCRMSFRSQEGPLRRSNSGAGLTTVLQLQQQAPTPQPTTTTSPKRPPLSPTKKKQAEGSPRSLMEAPKESARREAPTKPAAAAAPATASSTAQDRPLLQPSPYRSLAQLLEMDKEKCAVPP